MVTLHITELDAMYADRYINPKHTEVQHTGKLSRTAIVRTVKRTLGLQGRYTQVDVYAQGITLHTSGKVIRVYLTEGGR